MASIIAGTSDRPNFKVIEAGTYVARCYSMIELGTIPVSFNNDTKYLHKVSIGWEIPEEKAVFNEDKGEQPFVVSKTYTQSMHEKANLRHDLESWRGKAYSEEEAKSVDITKLLGQPCMITIIHEKKDDKTYAKVTNISKLLKGVTCPPQVNPTRLLCFDDFDWELFESLSEYTKDKIKSSEQFKKLQAPNEVADSEDYSNTATEEDMPF